MHNISSKPECVCVLLPPLLLSNALFQQRGAQPLGMPWCQSTSTSHAVPATEWNQLHSPRIEFGDGVDEEGVLGAPAPCSTPAAPSLSPCPSAGHSYKCMDSGDYAPPGAEAVTRHALLSAAACSLSTRPQSAALRPSHLQPLNNQRLRRSLGAAEIVPASVSSGSPPDIDSYLQQAQEHQQAWEQYQQRQPLGQQQVLPPAPSLPLVVRPAGLCTNTLPAVQLAPMLPMPVFSNSLGRGTMPLRITHSSSSNLTHSLSFGRRQHLSNERAEAQHGDSCGPSPLADTHLGLYEALDLECRTMWLELLAVLALSGLAVAVSAPNTTSAGLVPITFGPSNLPGFEMGSTNRSSIIVVQEYWGVTDSVKAQAELLARQGFRVLIPDLYKVLPSACLGRAQLHGQLATAAFNT
ncbi:hypothetical protein QJQ45_002893 [Haematococcus lacustris]|nr:hypothetical protein QJQ45_002893 [Haematococcus lacustris]